MVRKFMVGNYLTLLDELNNRDGMGYNGRIEEYKSAILIQGEKIQIKNAMFRFG